MRGAAFPAMGELAPPSDLDAAALLAPASPPRVRRAPPPSPPSRAAAGPALQLVLTVELGAGRSARRVLRIAGGNGALHCPNARV